MKRITLTFDNGPHPQGTPELLRVLRERSLQATFFLVAQKLQDPALRELAVQARAEGHRIGNHTLTHGAPLGRRPGRAVAETEIGGAQELLSGLADAPLFRPNGERGQLGPHLLSRDAVAYLQQHDFTAVVWNCLPQDWLGPAGSWVQRCEALRQEQDWSAVVLHDHCQAGAMGHLEAWLERLLAQGCEFTGAFPPDCVLIDRGQAAPALEGRFQ